MRTYIGTYSIFEIAGMNSTEINVMVEEDGKQRSLDPCFNIRNHSPDGFNWGYGGSGPAQLALAIMCDVFGTPKREERLRGIHPVHYQDFKFAFVAKLPAGKSWRATEDEIREAVLVLRPQP
jgi:hypothetical protein